MIDTFGEAALPPGGAVSGCGGGRLGSGDLRHVARVLYPAGLPECFPIVTGERSHAGGPRTSLSTPGALRRELFGSEEPTSARRRPASTCPAESEARPGGSRHFQGLGSAGREDAVQDGDLGD